MAGAARGGLRAGRVRGTDGGGGGSSGLGGGVRGGDEEEEARGWPESLYSRRAFGARLQSRSTLRILPPCDLIRCPRPHLGARSVSSVPTRGASPAKWQVLGSPARPRSAPSRSLGPARRAPHQLLPRTDAAGRPRAPAPPARQRKSNDSPIYSAPATVVALASTSPSGAPAGPTHPRAREGPALSSRPRHGSTLVSPPPFTAADKDVHDGHGTYVRRLP